MVEYCLECHLTWFQDKPHPKRLCPLFLFYFQ
jgi:hypothetical protein